MKIVIGITTADSVCYETMESIYNLKKPEGAEVLLRIVHAYNVAEGRNNLVKIAKNEHADYLFFIDSDVVVPDHALITLLNTRVHVVNGTYPRKEIDTIVKENPFTTLYRHDRKNMNKINFGPFFMPLSELPKSGLVQVDAAGLGCTLINMEVFDLLRKNDDWFVFAKEFSQIENGPYCVGEDLYFYRSLLRIGIQPYAEGSVRCGHVGKIKYEFKNYIEETKNHKSTYMYV